MSKTAKVESVVPRRTAPARPAIAVEVKPPESDLCTNGSVSMSMLLDESGSPNEAALRLVAYVAPAAYRDDLVGALYELVEEMAKSGRGVADIAEAVGETVREVCISDDC